MRIPETDIYLKNDVMKLIKYFEFNSAIPPVNLPFVNKKNFKSKIKQLTFKNILF